MHIRGLVQGVGFRPFIYALATGRDLTGWVRNTSSGVDIEVNGPADGLQDFLLAIQRNPPPLARIDKIESQACPPNGYTQFSIHESQPQPGEFIPVSPDVSICADCQRELFDPSNRRYRYPFINCTNCGPRFSIINDIPYDRPNTSMAGFPFCPACKQEYENPLDRRFHAQPVACPTCGPQIWFEVHQDRLSQGEDALQQARNWLRQGKILAVKGLGGFHLVCDATNPTAVTELRRRKQRVGKPFALMAFDLEAVHRYAEASDEEQTLLESFAHPIVLLSAKSGTPIAPDVAPRQNSLGIMLPYTPLHLLLLEPASDYPDLFVMTSANLNEEPIAYQDEEARTRLSSLADGFLMHNRPIHSRVDDSVARIFDQAPYFARRSRGYAPNPILLSESLPPILAAGAELKNTFCLTRQDYAFISHYIGDLENYETLVAFEESIAHYERLFRIQPEILACDLHPDYLATRYAQERSRRSGLPLILVQHHHAHLAACLAENGWPADEPAIGLSFDGTGLGSDGAIWGGEILLGSYATYQRLYHLAYVPLPGGDLAVRHPARMALAHLWQAGIDWEPVLPPAEALCFDDRTALRGQLEHHLNSPLTSSMGRLFDAVSALIGVCQRTTYEGQAAIELEMAVDPHENGFYAFEIRPGASGESGVIDPRPMWETLIADWLAATPVPILAARFHNGLAQLATDLCLEIRRTTGASTVAFSGGVWQNRCLLQKTTAKLRRQNFKVLLHRQLPPNDGCIALGQAMIAAHQP